MIVSIVLIFAMIPIMAFADEAVDMRPLGVSGDIATPTDAVIVAALNELPDEILFQGYDYGEIECQADLILPDELTGMDTYDHPITIENIVWSSSPAFDPTVSIDFPGYVFTPELPVGYILAEDVTLPVITVFIRPEGGVEIMPLMTTQNVTTFAQLQNVIASYATAVDDITITVCADFALTSNLTIPSNPNGKTLTITSNGTVRTFTRGFRDTNENSGLFIIGANASLIMENIIIDGDKNTFSYDGNSAKIIYIDGSSASFELRDGAALTNNTGSWYGGGVYISGGTFIMNGGEISENSSGSGHGGGVYVSGDGIFVMNKGEISGNYSYNGGAGVYLDSGDFTMTGGKIRGNTGGDGSGVNISKGTFTMDGGEISNNASSGIYVSSNVASNAVFNMNDGIISNNGVGVKLYNGLFTMTGGKISDNGWGVIVSFSRSFTMLGGEISSNTTYGVYISSYGTENLLLSGKPIINDGVYTQGSLSTNISIADDLELGALIVILGSDAANQMQAGTAVASYTGTGSLTENMAKAFVSNNGTLVGTASGNNVVWSPAFTSTYVTTNAELLGAIAAYPIAVNDMTITVGADFALPSNLAIPGNANGKTLTIISDSTTRTLTRGFSDTNWVHSGLFIIKPGASLILEKIIVDGDADTFDNNEAPLVNVSGGNASLELRDGVVLKNNRVGALYSGGVNVDSDGSNGGIFVMSGGEIIGNTAGRYGGGVYVETGSTFTMNGGKISDNTAIDSGVGAGGGVYVAYYGTFTMNDGEISDNAADNGGGVGVAHTFTMNGGKISGNIADDGGGVHIDSGSFTMSGGEISGNAAWRGGGVHAWEGAFTMNGGEISGNNSNLRGAKGSGVYLSNPWPGSQWSQPVPLKLSGTPVIRDGIYTQAAFYSHISITSNLEAGTQIVLEGSEVANQMQADTIVASYIGVESLTENMAKAFVSQNSRLIGTISGNNVVWRLASADASLSALTVSNGTLTPVFDPSIRSYTAFVTNSVSSITIFATANHTGATVTGTGTRNLAVGMNYLDVTVTAENGAKQTYTITVTREAASDAGGGSSGGGSRGGGGGATVGSTVTPPVNVTSAQATDVAQKAAAAAKTSGVGTAIGNMRNVGNVPLAALQAMAKAAGMPFKFQADSMNGNAVDVRITIDPAKATKDVNLYVSTTSDQGQKVKSMFEKWFINNTIVVNCVQKGDFGIVVEIATKIDLKLDSKTLIFYTYDSATNTYKQITPTPKYWVDKSGYLHFETSMAGDIIITDRPLQKK